MCAPLLHVNYTSSSIEMYLQLSEARKFTLFKSYV